MILLENKKIVTNSKVEEFLKELESKFEIFTFIAMNNKEEESSMSASSEFCKSHESQS